MICMGGKVNSCRILFGKSETKRLLVRLMLRVEDNINIYLDGQLWTGLIWLWTGTCD